MIDCESTVLGSWLRPVDSCDLADRSRVVPIEKRIRGRLIAKRSITWCHEQFWWCSNDDVKCSHVTINNFAMATKLFCNRKVTLLTFRRVTIRAKGRLQTLLGVVECRNGAVIIWKTDERPQGNTQGTRRFFVAMLVLEHEKKKKGWEKRDHCEFTVKVYLTNSHKVTRTDCQREIMVAHDLYQVSLCLNQFTLNLYNRAGNVIQTSLANIRLSPCLKRSSVC